jgi:hypothetical protein
VSLDDAARGSALRLQLFFTKLWEEQTLPVKELRHPSSDSL